MRVFFLGQRSAFISCWVRWQGLSFGESPAHKVLGLVRKQKLVGYGVLRPCQQGYKIGSLFADSARFAEYLFLALKAKVEPSNPLYLDAPSTNVAVIALAEKYQMASVFETARMYNRTVPELPLHRIYGITTFEL